MRRRDLSLALGGAVAATVLGGGLAWAAIPSAGGSIDGCYQKESGQLRVVDRATDACHPSEVAIAWNQTGPQGAQGPKGDKGDTGETGAKGDKGDTGEAGPKGDKGDKGDTGDTGPQGPTGLQGVPGQQGPPGRTVPDTDTFHVPLHVTAMSSVGGDSIAEVTASCPSGLGVTGGGFINENDLNVLASHPAAGGGGWRVSVKNHRILPGQWSFGAWAICASPVVRVNN